ncbi:MAG: FAD-binding oxidoreductase [Candidatus Bathyarchaeia archaeon]
MSTSFVEGLRKIVGPENTLTDREHLFVYRCDAAQIFIGNPVAVIFPTSVEQVSEVVKLCNMEKISFIPRGSGTGLSGGAVPLEGGVVIETSKMNRVIEIDFANERAVVESGLINLQLSASISQEGFHYVPDPSSQQACTLGGNIAHNSGGPHCLKYGVTTSHVLGLEVVLPTGEIVNVGGKSRDIPGYDLTGVFVGSEGTLGIVTKMTLRIHRKPEAIKTLMAVFATTDDASNTVSDIIANGILPAAVEMMDKLAIKAIELSQHACSYPKDAGAVLLIEVDGLKDGLERQIQRIKEICSKNRAREVREAKDEAERKKFWTGRKGAFPAMGSLSPNYVVQDGVIPRTKLPQALRKINKISETYGLQIANVFHAGDGNLHPLIAFDLRKPGEKEKAFEASVETLKVCIEAGGVITGEHGIGMEKRDVMPLLFSQEDLAAMKMLRDVFNPHGSCNPSKVLPTKLGCVGPSSY